MTKSILRSLFVAVACLGLAAVSFADTSKPKVVGLLFYADWCGSCKELDPKLNAVKKDFSGQPILFTRVDLTDDFTKQQSALLASQLGLDAAYAENAPKTGFMLLIDPATGRVLSKLTKAQSEEDLRAEIKKVLTG